MPPNCLQYFLKSFHFLFELLASGRRNNGDASGVRLPSVGGKGAQRPRQHRREVHRRQGQRPGLQQRHAGERSEPRLRGSGVRASLARSRGLALGALPGNPTRFPAAAAAAAAGGVEGAVRASPGRHSRGDARLGGEPACRWAAGNEGLLSGESIRQAPLTAGSFVVSRVSLASGQRRRQHGCPRFHLDVRRVVRARCGCAMAPEPAARVLTEIK